MSDVPPTGDQSGIAGHHRLIQRHVRIDRPVHERSQQTETLIQHDTATTQAGLHLTHPGPHLRTHLRHPCQRLVQLCRVLTNTTPSPTPTPTPAPTPTSTATPTPTSQPTNDPSALANITEDGEVTVEEAQAILDAHMAIINPPFLRLLQSDEELPPLVPEDIVQSLLAIYTDGLATSSADVLTTQLADGLALYDRQNPSGQVEEVLSVEGFDKNCIQLLASQDFNGFLRTHQEPTTIYLELFQPDAEAPRNDTTWIRHFEGMDAPIPDISCID